MEKTRSYEELQAYIAKLENRIRDLEAQLEGQENQTARLKARFLSNISHELRTPMNAILGFSSLLNDQKLPSNKREEYMDHINQSSARLLNVVEEMIDVSMIQTGQLKIRIDECLVNQVLSEIYHYYNVDRHRNQRNHIALLLNLGARGKDFRIFTDQFRLHQVISNLLGNAFKYTEKGIIEFGYSVEDEEKEKVTFFVTDSGKGIQQEKFKEIFDSFERGGDEDAARKLDGGIGLGLTLSKGIVELMGGKIWVEENVFKGTTFKFSLPTTAKEEMDSQENPFSTNNLFIA